jgi:hypothetical protein
MFMLGHVSIKNNVARSFVTGGILWMYAEETHMYVVLKSCSKNQIHTSEQVTASVKQILILR